MWRDYIRRVEPYTPGEQPNEGDIIKLNTNENPYPPSKRVSDILREYDYSNLNRYPDPNVCKLREAIAEYHNVNSDNVFVGVGSDDVLAMCYMTFFNSDKPILFPDITYSFYDVWAKQFGVPYNTKPLDEDYRIKASDYHTDNGGIIIPNPNAPTGISQGAQFFEDILKHNRDSIVIIDEAYVDYGADSCESLLESYDNLIVVRTFSKSRSMAGSRIGYALSSSEVIAALNNVKHSFNSYTMDRLTIELAVASLLDDEYFKDNINRVICTRKWTYDKLVEMGFSVLDSSANFLFVRPKGISAKDLYNRLREKGILVRYFNKPRIDQYLRITIGTDEDMHIFCDEVYDIISGQT